MLISGRMNQPGRAAHESLERNARNFLARRLFTGSILVLLMCPPSVALAADPVAESMFQQGLTMMREGHYEDACRILQASQTLEPKSGTILVLASCHEQVGRTATAWAGYKEAAARARSEGRANHADKATELAKALEPKLSMLRIDAQLLQGGVTIVVKLNGKPVVDGSLGVAFAVDPGDHLLFASAEGRKDWQLTVKVGANGDRQTVLVPELELAAPAVAPVPTPTLPGVEPTPPILPTPPAAESPTNVWPWVVGGLGVGLLAGSAAGLAVSLSASATLNEQCGSDRGFCVDGYDFESDRTAELAGFGSFIGLGIAGVAAVTTGIVGLATGGAGESVEASLGFDENGGFASLKLRYD